MFVDDRVDAGLELYFAPAKYKEISVEIDGKMRQRVASNVLSVSALWMDLDVGSEPHKYASKKEAGTHLVQFCKAIGLPRPTIVDSGGGVHVYWMLRKPLAPDRWLTLAGWLKAVAAHWGLKQDNTRTADMASILRIPGTFNHKQETRRPVQVVGEMYQSSAKDLAVPLGVYFQTKNLTLLSGQRTSSSSIAGAPPAGSLAAASGITSQFGAVAQQGIVKYDPVSLDDVASACQQVAAVLDCGGNVPEPLWYAAIGLACFTDNPDDIHRVSDGHPGYSEEATEAKAAQWRANATGPATCARFESANPAGCKGCPHYGSAVSPAQLGRVVDPVQAPLTPSVPKHVAAHSSFPPVYNAAGEQIGIVAPCPQGWRRSVNGIERAIKGKDGVLEWVTVVPNLDVLPVNWTYDRAHGATMMTRFTDVRGVCIDQWINVAELMSGGAALAEIFSRLCAFVTSSQHTATKDYLVAYMASLRDAQRSEEVRRQLGWQDDDSFVLPEAVYYPDGRVVPSRADASNELIFNFFTKNGDETAWKRALNLYNRPGGEAYAFAGLTGLASTLMRLTPYHGVTVALWGPSGVGKTTIQQLALGAWGEPTKMATLRDTRKSREHRMGITNSLPLCLNEASDMDAMEASSIVYATTEGTFGTALTAARRQNTDPAEWDMISIWSMNRSLRALMAQGKADTEAESLRVFEIHIDRAVGTKAEVDAAYEDLRYNHGEAGRKFIHYVVNHREEVAAMLAENAKRVEQQAAATVQERYWVTLVSTVLTANQIARKIGLSDISTGALAKFGISTLLKNRRSLTVSRVDSAGILSRYLTEHANGVLTIAQNPSTGALHALEMPRSALVATLFPNTGKMLLDRGAFARWCNRSKLDADHVIHDLQTRHIVTQDNLRGSLGAGLTTIVTGTATLFELDCRHASMASGVTHNPPHLKVV